MGVGGEFETGEKTVSKNNNKETINNLEGNNILNLHFEWGNISSTNGPKYRSAVPRIIQTNT